MGFSDNPATNDLLTQIFGGIVRTGMAAFGAWAAAGGIAVTGTQLDQLTGSAMILAALAWSSIQKWLTQLAARKREVSAAKASAQQGEAVTVTETPPGQINFSTPVPPAEAAAAPSAPYLSSQLEDTK
jgi:hypothetical protein